MKQVTARAIVLLTMSILATQRIAFAKDSFLAERQCLQLIVVTTESWSASTGTLVMLERPTIDADWHRLRGDIPVVVGKAGMAWGLGIVAGNAGGDLKHEGDNKAPAGVFALPEVFGYAPHCDTKMKYRQVTPEILCIDDQKSAHYTRLMDTRAVRNRDWTSAEEMRRKDDLYKWGVVVEHNRDASPGSGSCIFLHVWRGPGQPTVGCTAMAERHIVDLIRWLDPRRAPLLVQLPQKTYAEYSERWSLPSLR